MSPFLIYLLSDPYVAKRGYVGRTCKGLSRPRFHQRASKLKADRDPKRTNNPEKAAWIEGLPIRKGTTRYDIVVLEEFGSVEELVDVRRYGIWPEEYWRQRLLSEGWKLFNKGPCGPSPMSGTVRSEATRAKLRAVQKAVPIGSRLRGAEHGIAKLDEAAILNIRSSNSTITELGRLYGVTKQNISMIRKRITWRHVL